MSKTKPRREGNQGMNWIKKAKRLAIYLRDGLACVYCGLGVEEGAQLTLDHLRAVYNGGQNNSTNLVTACHGCNSARGRRPWREFVLIVVHRHGASPEQVATHVCRTRMRGIAGLVVRSKQTLAVRSWGEGDVLHSMDAKLGWVS